MYRHLEEIVDASGELFSHRNLNSLMSGVLNRLSRHIRMDWSGSDQLSEQCEKTCSLAVLKQKDETVVISGTGKYKEFTGKNINHVLSPAMVDKLRSVYARGKSVVEGNEFFAYMRSAHDIEGVLYFDNVSSLGDADHRLVQLYITNVASALDSFVVNEELVTTQKELVITLGEVIETRSKESANHVRRVAEYSYLLATLYGLSVSESRTLRFAAPMHDAGKIGIPDSILNKPGKLTAEEFSVMEEHTVMGYDILQGSERPILKAAAIVAYEHHEKWNGQGYPRKLAGENIHIYGRIVALADVFDALGSVRCYKDAWPLQDILDLIEKEKGGHFDPKLADLMLGNLEEFLQIRVLFPDG